MSTHILSRAPMALFLLALGSTPALASNVKTLVAIKDNTMYSESGSLSNGAGAHMFIGRTGPPGDLRRALVAFDIAGEIPAGSSIQSVTLNVECTMSAPFSGPRTATLHRVNTDWGQGTSDAGDPGGAGTTATAGDATWTDAMFGSTTWGTAGGDFAGASASVSIDDLGSYTWTSTASLVGDVQAWVDTPASNFGWVIRGDESVNRTAKRLSTSEDSFPGSRPTLTITYVPPIPTMPQWGLIAMSLLLVGAGAMVIARKRAMGQ